MAGNTWNSKDYDGIYEIKSACSEERLWMAVIESAVQDYRLILRHAKRDMERTGKYSGILYREYAKLRHEFSSEWFEQVCEWAGIHQSRLQSLMDKEAKAMGLTPENAIYTLYQFHGQMFEGQRRLKKKQ